MSSKNLLVVDDSATTRMLITITLKKEASYRITEARDGTEAMSKLEREPFDMVVTDINMPNMNGLELIAQVRAKHKELPIIVITTQGEEGDRDRGLAQGANAYLTKPISAPKLLALVKELLLEKIESS